MGQNVFPKRKTSRKYQEPDQISSSQNMTLHMRSIYVRRFTQGIRVIANETGSPVKAF